MLRIAAQAGPHHGTALLPPPPAHRLPARIPPSTDGDRSTSSATSRPIDRQSDGDALSDHSAEQAARENEVSVALMEQVRDGDHRAFEQLVRQHQQAVIGTIARMTGRLSDAEDLAQQVFFRIWRSAPRYQPTAKFSTWLFTITRNVVFNEHRKINRRREMSLEDLPKGSPGRTPADSRSTPDGSLVEGELQRAIDQALVRLPEKQRLALVLRRYEEMPYEQIGEILGLSLSAVKSMIFRARNTLRELLEPYLRSDD